MQWNSINYQFFLIDVFISNSTIVLLDCIIETLFFLLYKTFYFLQNNSFRSLVALSLILALLLLKPAPIYILDEVDAALDLSHTQNIGRMLKDHFRHSQVCYLRFLGDKLFKCLIQHKVQTRGRQAICSRGPNFRF